MHEKEYMKELAVSGGTLLPNIMTMVIRKGRFIYVNYWYQNHRQRFALKPVE